ncbi:peptidoglycan-binding protein, partial [Sinorhizobium medicae]
MRKFESPQAGKSMIRLCAAILLAGVATGCSSDASRFGGLFSRSDDIMTGSIPQGSSTMPRGDVASGGAAPSYGNGASVGQSYPAGGGGYNAAAAPVSSARVASTPMAVQRTSLDEPSATSGQQQVRTASLDSQAAALPRSQPQSGGARDIPSKGGWSASNAPTILVRQG